METSCLKDLLSLSSIKIADKYLICLAADSYKTKEVKEIKAIALKVGAKKLGSSTSNPSAYLSRMTEFAVKAEGGWELTSKGVKHVKTLLSTYLPSSSAPVLSPSLRQHAANITNRQTRIFIEEAIQCLENGLWRPAIVFSWVGAVAVLYDHVVSNRLIEFNNEALRREQKWRNASTTDDLAKMKEYDFLQVLSAISVIGKNVKQELENCLTLRNGCGHPNSLKVGENKAAAHIETLIQNVYGVF